MSDNDKKIKLQDLMNGESGEITKDSRNTHIKVDIADIAKNKKQTTADKVTSETEVAIDLIDLGISEKMKRFEKLEERVHEVNIEKELDSSDDIINQQNVKKDDEIDIDVKSTNLKMSQFNELLDDEIFIEEDDDLEDVPKSVKENIEEMKETVKNISTISKKVDFSGFKVRSKPMPITKALKFTELHNIKYTADWVLYNTRRPFSISAISGHELVSINPFVSNRNNLNSYRNMYGTIYNHIEDANKPDFESWVKTINYFDRGDLFFGTYRACFGAFNHIPYNCPYCGKMFIKKYVNVDDMVKYENDEVKENVKKIFNKDTTSTGYYESELVQISDDYAFTFKPPSIYDVVFEQSMLAEEFVNEHQALLNAISYIDTVFYIDTVNNELVPIDMGGDENDFQKTIARKIKGHVKIFDRLSSDQHNLIFIEMKKIKDLSSSNIKYVLPKVECENEKCKKEIPEEEKDPLDMLFTRHQLVTFANM